MSGEIEVAMNCRAIRERLNEALAAGKDEALDSDAALHLQACHSCRDHFDAQAKLYAAINSGVRRLVDNVAPPSLLPGVRERLAATEAQPNPGWVRVLISATVLLLVASALLVLSSRVRKVEESSTADVPASQPHVFPHPPESRQLRSSEGETVATNRRPKTSHHISTISHRVAVATAPVIVDPRETAAFASMVNEIARNSEIALPALHKGSLPASQGEAIEPVRIARLEIPALVAEAEAKE
jgi:hypothetical protein